MPERSIPDNSDQPSIVVKTVGEERNLPPPVRQINLSTTRGSSARIQPLADSAPQEHHQDRR